VIRVLIAEDMHMIRGALVALLSLEDDMQVVAELERGDQIVPAALETRPTVAVIDIDLPGLDGLTAADQLYQRLPECRTLVLTGLSQPGNLLRALKVHVRGFIVKDATVCPAARTDSRSSPSTPQAAPLSSAPVGSSAKITAGWVTSARAIAARCCCPPDSAPGRSPRRPARPTRPMT
jgi:CheY-like chemotaxis protein